MTNFVHSILRVAAWILVILGVLFTVLKAFLIGVPALIAGTVLLWATNRVGGNTTTFSTTAAAESDLDNPAIRSIEERNDPASPYFVPNDQDAGNPLFGIDDLEKGRDHG